jgi:CheY-like chemotaxis protein
MRRTVVTIPNLVKRTRKILLVEDNPGDMRLLKEAFVESSTPHELLMAYDGEEALAFLEFEKANGEAQRIDLIVLDVNLPKRNGHQVLQAIKSDPVLTRIPVLMLSSSDAPTDVRTAYDLHANAYLRKPTELTDYFELIENVQHFWLNIVRLPHRPN